MFDISGKVAIVTGGAKGIGKGIVLTLAKCGVNVVVASRTPDDVMATAAEATALGTEVIGVPTDVRNSAQVDNLVQKTVKEFGKIDILVNNAGGSLRIKILDLEEKGWDAAINLNLKAAFLCSKAVAKLMISQNKGGSVINIASVHGLLSAGGFAHYGAAKAGLMNLTKSMALEWAEYNIRVNCIVGGYFDTEQSRILYKGMEEIRERQRETIPLKRLGTPEDVAATAVFLASDEASYITGDTILVSGGIFGAFDAGQSEHLSKKANSS